MPQSWAEWTNYGIGAFCATLGAVGVAFVPGLEAIRLYLIGAGVLFLILSVIFFALGVRHSSWCSRLAERWRPVKRKLRAEPLIDALLYAYPAHFDRSVFSGHSFALLHVRNRSEGDVPNLIARCFVDDDFAEEIPCFWSLETGGRFTTGGSHGASLTRGDARLLLIAQVFIDEKLWARLPERQEHAFNSHARATRIGGIEIVHFVSRGGEVVDIGHNARITVYFQAKELEQRQVVRLGFKKAGGEIGSPKSVWVPDITAV